jgi:hypothetical protein
MIGKTVRLIQLQEWNDLVRETYERPYDFQQQNGCRERGTFEFTVPLEEYGRVSPDETIKDLKDTEEMVVGFDAWSSRDPKAPLSDQRCDFELNLWWLRNFYPQIEDIIDDLYSKGELVPGDYVIQIDW